MPDDDAAFLEEALAVRRGGPIGSHTRGRRGGNRSGTAGVRKPEVAHELVVACCKPATTLGPLLDVGHLDAEHGALHAFHPIVVPLEVVVVTNL